jgi:uncharacterized membrane protein YsdA (DUF1294 family)
MTPEQKWVVVACVVALVLMLNASAFVFFMLDKYLAEERRRRIPESTLLFLALVGGSAGTIAAQQFLRHKTQKEPFRTMLFSIAGLHVLILAWLLMR